MIMLTIFILFSCFFVIVLWLCRYQIPENWLYQEARILFKDPLVSAEDQQPEIKWSSPDEEVLYFAWLLSFYLFCILEAWHRFRFSNF